jgi:stage V sporulation protein D (sporulation-specific penicillin-binding protein)
MMASYFKVLPEETVIAKAEESGADYEAAKMPRIKDKTFSEAKLLLAEEKIKYQRHGFGKVVIEQEPEPGEKMVSGKYAQIFLGDENAGNKEKTYMPNVKGMTVRRAMEVLRLYGLKAKCTGSGFAVSQDPKPGVAMKKGAACTVSFDMRDGV